MYSRCTVLSVGSSGRRAILVGYRGQQMSRRGVRPEVAHEQLVARLRSSSDPYRFDRVACELDPAEDASSDRMNGKSCPLGDRELRRPGAIARADSWACRRGPIESPSSDGLLEL